MQELERRDGKDRRQDALQVFPCSMHDKMPELISKMATSSKWLVRLTVLYMTVLGGVIGIGVNTISSAAKQYAADMQKRDDVRGALAKDIAAIATRASVLETVLTASNTLTSDKLNEIKKLLDKHSDSDDTSTRAVRFDRIEREVADVKTLIKDLHRKR
jgi:hypothetical protein